MESILKVIVAFVGTVISALIGGLGLSFTVLLGMMLIDVVTGLMVGWYKGKLQSSVGIKGLIKKSYILILIGTVYLFQIVLPIAEFAGDGITIAFIVMEFISIIENGGKLGVPLPVKLVNAIAVLKGTKNVE